MLPSRGYQPSYPPPRNYHGQQQQQQQQQQQSTLQGNIYQQGPLPTYEVQPLAQGQGQGHQSTPQAQGQQTTDTPANGNGGIGGGGEMNLASVLHYLQSEWRRWERDRNEWEIERAEMRARIALLEGQRRSAENLKVDLLRRVKMLEFALRQERSKSVNTTGRASGIAPSKLATLQEDDRASSHSKDEKEGSDSGGSEDRDRDHDGKVNGHAGSSKMSAMSKSSSDSNSGSVSNNTWKSVGAVPRDPKSRARSREYLKQCLQEITYLTSPGALNPLPPRPLISEPDSIDPKSTGEPVREPERPTKALPTRALPSMFERPKEPEASTNTSGLPNGSGSSQPTKPPSPTSDANRLQSLAADSSKPPSSPLVHTRALPESDEAPVDMTYPEQSKQLLTAIYRPESKSAWRQELKSANDKAEQAQREQTPERFSDVALNASEDTNWAEKAEAKTWKVGMALRGHLDTVRSVAIASGQGITLVTGGDDNTVKLWSVDVQRMSSRSPTRPNTQTDQAYMTYRGHTAAITSVLTSPVFGGLVFSASLDSTIRVWRLADPNTDPYASYNPALSLQTLVGHSEAIWDLCLLPTQSASQSQRLASASADGTVKIWIGEADKPWKLHVSVGDFGEGVVPTCLGVYHSDYTKLLVGLSDGSVQLYNVEQHVKETIFYAGMNTRVNAVLSHPTLPIIAVAYEDGHIRTFSTDLLTSDSTTPLSPKETIFAGSAPITTLSLSPSSPTNIISASTTCMIRVWDLTKNVSVQDIESHRVKGGEGICQVVGHPDLPIMASAGADGLVRLWRG